MYKLKIKDSRHPDFSFERPIGEILPADREVVIGRTSLADVKHPGTANLILWSIPRLIAPPEGTAVDAIKLDDDSIAAYHGILRREEMREVVYENRSKNGTRGLFGSQKLTLMSCKTCIRPGDELYFGAYTLSLVEG